ncbi:IS30 family transposase [Paraburkholderia sp. GAS42]|jgi:IS30 family transposase
MGVSVSTVSRAVTRLEERLGGRLFNRTSRRLALTLTEREEISRALVAGRSIRSIAVQLERTPSTIGREIARNGGQEGYRASQADQLAWDRGRRPKVCRLVENRALANIVAGRLKVQWSPQQIAGWLKRTYPANEDFQVSHETIYRSLFVLAPSGEITGGIDTRH